MQGCHKTSVSTPVCWNVCQKNCLSELPSLWITVHLPNCPLVGTSIHLNTGLSEHPSVHMPICQKVCLPERFSVRMCVHVFECPSVKMSFWIWICLNMNLSEYPFFRKSISEHLCVRTPISKNAHLSECVSICSNVHLFVCPSFLTYVHLSEHPLSEHQSVCANIHLSACLSAKMALCLNIYPSV